MIVRAGVPHTVHEYEPPDRHGRDRDRRPTYGVDAAAALGIDPGRVHKTLAATVDGRLVLAVVPVDRELDLKRLAEAAGGRRAVMAEPAAAERATGYVVGGMSPLGSRRALPVFVDAAALELASIFVSAGRRGLQVRAGAPGPDPSCPGDRRPHRPRRPARVTRAGSAGILASLPG